MIEEEKRKARERDLERKQSVSRSTITPTSATISPSLWAGHPFLSPSTVIPGLDYDWAREDDLERKPQISPDKDDDETSAATLGVSDEPRHNSTGNSFAGLVSARKRSRVGQDMEENVKPARRLKSPVEVDEEEDDDSYVGKRSKRPFAPPKKPSRVSRPAYDEM